VAADEQVVASITEAVAANIGRLRREGRTGDAEWWQAQLAWVERHRAVLSG
jgi:hypothetical protein